MGFVKVARIDEFMNVQKMKIRVEGKEILLLKIDGNYYAVSNKCPHMGGSLYDGKLENGVITCPRHGAKYDAKTGIGIGNPKILFLKFDVKNDQSYPVKVEDTDIYIDVNKK
jgi:3-phenylpropionate/trans-cinnamate dioxygenase ferredoxin subunit